MVEHSTHDLQVDGSNPAAGTSSGSTVAGHLTHDPEIKGLSTPAPAATGRGKLTKIGGRKCVYVVAPRCESWAESNLT